jgi:hypothetical protein
MLSHKYSSEWLKYLRYDIIIPQFPREFGLWRMEVEGEAKYISLISAYEGRSDCYTSLYPKIQIDNNIVDVIFLEIDCEDIEKLNKLGRMMNMSLINRKIFFKRFFSGGRSFHYYIPLYPIKLKNPSGTIRKFVENLPDVVDPHTIGNMRQMCRIPYTRHKETSLYMYECYGDVSLAEALNPTPLNIPLQINYDLSKNLLLLDKPDREEEAPPPNERLNLLLEEGILPPCIVNTLDELVGGEPSHQSRLHLVAFLNKLGFSIEEIVDVFSKAKDFSKTTTTYQVRKIVGANLNCYMCRRAFELGICPLADPKECRYFPTLNRSKLR